MEGICDLHTHSYYSDGTLSPAQLIREAEKTGLAAVALSDHNTVRGLPEFQSAARGSTVQAVPAIEFSTEYRGAELHILGMFLPERSYDEIEARMEKLDRDKEQSNIALVEALSRAGYVLDYGAIRDRTPTGHINRAHIAAELTRLGYTASVKEAFSELLAPEHGYYHPPQRPDAFETIRYIRSIGAVAVWAHPFLSLKEEASLTEFLEQAKEAGLTAMETRYPLFDGPTSRKAAELAERFGLLQSGGSDFHGEAKPDIRLGTGRGDLIVPMTFLRALECAKTTERIDL